MTSYNSLLESIGSMAESLQALNRRAVLEYTPIIEDILHSRSRDKNYIEHTLDGLLGFCGHEPALGLYKKLCRHYWEIDPAATASYIYLYREMWDQEDSPLSEKEKSSTRRTSKKTAAAARRKRRIANLPNKTRTALGKQAAKVARQKRAGR